MNEVSRNIMVGACELACRYPELSEDVAEDARKEESVLMAACWFIGADRNLSPNGAIEKVLNLWDAVNRGGGES